jgi:hypothetical protein
VQEIAHKTYIKQLPSELSLRDFFRALYRADQALTNRRVRGASPKLAKVLRVAQETLSASSEAVSRAMRSDRGARP